MEEILKELLPYQTKPNQIKQATRFYRGILPNHKRADNFNTIKNCCTFLKMKNFQILYKILILKLEKDCTKKRDCRSDQSYFLISIKKVKY